MKAMKTLFEYLLRCGASAGAVWDSRWHCSTHRNETSADEARAVCY
jgi:hypothetical protein